MRWFRRISVNLGTRFAEITPDTSNRQALQAAPPATATRQGLPEIFLADMADFAGMNEAWDTWVPDAAAPARATVQAKLGREEWKIEIVVTAAVP